MGRPPEVASGKGETGSSCIAPPPERRCGPIGVHVLVSGRVVEGGRSSTWPGCVVLDAGRRGGGSVCSAARFEARDGGMGGGIEQGIVGGEVAAAMEGGGEVAPAMDGAVVSGESWVCVCGSAEEL